MRLTVDIEVPEDGFNTGHVPTRDDVLRFLNQELQDCDCIPFYAEAELRDDPRCEVCDAPLNGELRVHYHTPASRSVGL